MVESDKNDNQQNTNMIELKIFSKENSDHIEETQLLNQEENLKQIEKDAGETENKLSKKLKINYACMCFFSFLTGCDFAVILPTLWDRLHLDFNASGSFMGLVISSYSFSGVICGLIMGKLSDNKNKTKPFYLIGIFLSIIGHLIYFIGINKYIILAARAVSGLCLGASTVALAYVAKTTTEKQRIPIISVIMASRQLGLMLGPGFNFFLRKANFLILKKFPVDRKSSPGLFMALLWTICLFVILIAYSDHKIKKIIKNQESQNYENNSNEQKTKKLKLKDYKKEFMRIEIFVLLITTFFTYFNQTSLETIVIPFTEIMFGWNELHNSILFCVGGSIIIISYVLIRILSKKFEDRIILLMGIIIILIGLIIACSCLPFARQLNNPSKYQVSLYKTKNKNDQSLNNITSEEISFELENYTNNTNNQSINQNFNETNIIGISRLSNFNKEKIILNQTQNYDYQFFPAFAMFVLLDVLGLPAIAICSATLFTKLIDNKVQGFGQGIQRGVLGLGTIFGPLCAGPFVQRPIFLLAITLTFIGLIFFFVLLSFKHLKIKKSEKT